MREGHVLAARYRLLRRAAAGAMGTVYQALDSASGAHVAIKTIRIDPHREQARDRARLLREAEALAQLHHPAVVRYLDHGVSDESEPFLVMEWLDGGETLEDRLNAQGLTPVQSLQLAARLASGLAAVHACGVVHRDLKPSNVMLAGAGVEEAVLLDFGVARLTRRATELTATGDHVGTPCYMAPEQIRNPRTVDARADVFALGCILFECLTGRICFGGDDAVQVLAQILFASPRAPSALRADLSHAFDEVVATMLRRDANARPPSSVVERMLRDALEQSAANARGLPPPRRPSDDVSVLSLAPTLWEAIEEPPLPRSFQLGANAVAAATQRALPPYQGAFIGREATCAQLSLALRAGTPTVVVWGGPGIGKTRLVVEALRQITGADPPWDALVYGDLRDARTADDVVRLLARESGISLESSISPEIALGRALGKLGRVLLVLDPVEHLADLLAATVHAFARTSPRTQVLAISRRRWSAVGAVSIEVGPLSTQTDGTDPSPAATLLLERGGWLHKTDRISAGRGPAISDRAERLARALEGIPLAIELSATHAQLLGLDGLLARVCGARDPKGSESTSDHAGPMARALDRSWDLLTQVEREAFTQCAVFRGGFTVHAAEAVVRVGPAAPSTLALLQSLRDSSLLYTSSTEPSGEGRLSMFAPMQEFASDRLRGAEREDALRRHAEYFANLESHRPYPTAAERIARVELEADNLLAAAEFCLADDRASATAGMKALVTLEPAIFTRGAVTQYIELLERAVARAESAPPDSAEAITGMIVRQTRARLDAPLGRLERARTDLGLCLEDARRRRDLRREGAVLLDLGVAHHLDRALESARDCYATAMAQLADADDVASLGRCLGNIGAVCHDEGKLGDASRHYQQAIALLDKAGEERRRANFIANFAVLEQELGHLDESRRLFEEALALLERFRDARLLAITLGNFGALELEQGQSDRALELHTRSLALLAGTDDVSSRGLCLGRLAASLSVLGRTAEAELRLLQAEHVGMQSNRVVKEAVSLARGFLELALAKEARAHGLPAAAEEKLRAARARVRLHLDPEGDRQLLRERSDDLRAMLRVLSVLIERFGS